MRTPRYFSKLFSSSFTPFINSLDLRSFFAFLGLKNKTFDFPTLRLSLLPVSQSNNFFNSIFKMFSRSVWFLCEQKILVSSANRKKVRVEETLVISFMYIRNVCVCVCVLSPCPSSGFGLGSGDQE